MTATGQDPQLERMQYLLVFVACLLVVVFLLSAVGLFLQRQHNIDAALREMRAINERLDQLEFPR